VPTVKIERSRVYKIIKEEVEEVVNNEGDDEEKEDVPQE
jgi:hypothetical protein